MKINNLVLKNFKSVIDESFTFDDGIICFAGDNGEGKSTVIHAILMLLFNSYDLSFKDYINWNASKFDISMTFEHNGEKWYEQFEYSEKSGSKRILKNIDTGDFWENSSAISKLSEIVDFDLAKASIVSMENDQNLITTTPAKRREYLKGLYNLEFKDQINAINVDLDKISKDKIRCEAEMLALEKQEFALKEHLPEAYSEEEYEKAKNEIEVLKTKAGELELQKSKREDIASKLSDVHLSIRQCVTYRSSLDDKIKSIERNILETEALVSDKQRENDLSELEDKLKKLNASFESENTRLSLDISKLTDRLNESESIPDTTDERDKVCAEIRDKELECHKTQILISQSQEKLKILKTGKCPTCGHEISSEEVKAEENALAELQDKHRSLESAYLALTVIDGQLKDKQDEKDNAVRSTKAELTKTQDLLRSLTTKHSHDVMQLQHEIEMYKINKNNEIAMLKSGIDNDRKMIESQREMRIKTEELLEQHKKSAESLSIELDKIDDPQPFIDDIHDQMSAMEHVVSEYKHIVDYNKWVNEYNDEQDKRRVERDDKVIALRNELRGYDEREAMIEKAKTIIVREFPSFVISYMVKSLENYVNEFLMKVYPKYQIKITESKNSLAITYGPNKADVKMASGFEKSAFSLAYMYALGKMQKYGILIIDEGDGAASDNNSLLFYNTVAKSQEFFPQIFCITHKEVAKELLQNTYHAQVYVAESGHYSKE